MSEEFAQISEEDFTQIEEETIGRDEFASRTGITPQTVSYHLRTGLLKRWVDSGDITTEPYQIPVKLVEWFLAHNGRKVGAKLSKNIERQSRPTAQIIEDNSSQEQKIFEKLVEKYEEDLRKAADEINRISKINEDLNKRLSDTSQKLARLEGEMKGKDELLAEKDSTIQAKDQAINAANAAVMLLEQQKQTLDAQVPKQIETALKKPWWRFGI